MPREEWGVIEGILVDHGAANKIVSCTRRHRPLEAGGLILGLRKGLYLHVVEITRPQAWDRQSATRFHRSPKGHRIAAFKHWRKSGEKMDWIGEWHSHPGFSLSPSSIDIRNWHDIVRKRKAGMVFPICDGRRIAFYLQVWAEQSNVLLKQFEKDPLGTFYLTPDAIKRRLNKTGCKASGSLFDVP